MIDNEKKVTAAEEKTEENGKKLTDEQLKQVSGGKEDAAESMNQAGVKTFVTEISALK